MSVTRRELLQLTAMTVTATSVAPRWLFAQTPAGAGQAPAAQTPPPPVTTFTDLRRNVSIFTGRGGTIAYLINPGGVAVVDTQYPDTAKICLDGLKTRASNRGLDYVINTHHHGDHTGGNGVFRDATKKIVAHAKVPELQKAALARAQQAKPPNPTPQTPTFPDTTFPEMWKENLGDEVISARHYGPAHTGGDIVVRFERANVAHMGDLMFNRMHPFIDRLAGASIAGWMTTLERVMKDLPNDTLFVFGHADPKFQITGGKPELQLQRDYFTALLDFTRAQIKAGKTREVFVKITEPLPKFPDHGPLVERTLGAAFDEVSASA